MENQHQHIKGYRDLSPVEIELMNEIKAKADEVGTLIERLKTWHYTVPGTDTVTNDHPDQRWVAIGATQLQQGFMALTRAVAKPTTF